ncbi:hypothetical protein [Agarilytica rhodophyticola]|uniref:hypothetical protein n=1 Tax=Agarilytica rhodophyticola TaxID=1737490 RepID=UPI001319DB9F|nr:hypothetical protein [Agarilytica rhodophyticola]
MKILMFAICLALSAQSFSAVNSPKGKITGFYTGWNEDNVRITIEGAQYQEENCPTKDGYMVSKKDINGYETHISVLLAAFMSSKAVKVVIEGCTVNRPKIIGVSID